MTARPELARPLGLSLAALFLVASILPPETSGTSLAGCGLLIAVASTVAMAMGRLPRRAWALVGTATALAFLGRFGVAPGGGLLPIAIVVAAMAVFGAAAAAAGVDLRERLALTLALAGSAVALRAVYEAAWGLDRMAAELQDHAALIPDASAIAGRLEQGRAYAGFPTPAAAGGFLVLALCATAGLALTRSGRLRGVLAAAALTQAAGLLATRSLTAAAALFVAIVIAMAASRSRRLGAAAAALLVGIALVGALRAGQVFSRASDDSPWRLRGGNVRIGLAIAGAHPWLGAGPGGYAEDFPRYRRPGDNESRHAHCLPVELAAELGWLPGLLASGAFFALFLGRLVGGFKSLGALERGVAVGCAAFALHNLVDFTAFLPSVLWVACALRGAHSSATAARGVESWAPRLAWSSCVLSAAGALVCAGMSAEARARSREAVLRGEAQVATASADRAVFWAPWSADAALLRAQARLGGDRDEEGLASAERDADRAVRLAPSRAAARDVRAAIRARRGDVPGAYLDLAAATTLHPLRDDYAKRLVEAAAALPRPPGEGSAR